MVHQPEIVFLDEPTAGLDVMSALSLREFIGELRVEDTTVFLTTHYIEEVDQLSDRIAILVKGKITTIDTSEIARARCRPFAPHPIVSITLSSPQHNSFP
jgi:ABC-2 type transport system ATP-binding protein